MTINDHAPRSGTGPTATDEPTAGTETFVVPDIGEEGCGFEEEQIDYYAPIKFD